ncbi:hypothetical protein VTP01DRAFT_10130 [Rhizomucor pusillus]|uniref:uncharacterized protein n=1 Tax=Rhizomucor pusillus TaxID=4840 RepID=UPI0037449295
MRARQLRVRRNTYDCGSPMRLATLAWVFFNVQCHSLHLSAKNMRKSLDIATEIVSGSAQKEQPSVN